MDTDLLAAWLGLPPGCWPPDDRTLLGFGPEVLDPTMIEARTLSRMDQLRPHQLLHPELVTEGMNRLAQAMIALSNPSQSSIPPPGSTELYTLIWEEPDPHVAPAPAVPIVPSGAPAMGSTIPILDAEVVAEPIPPLVSPPHAVPLRSRTVDSPLRLTGLESVAHPHSGATTNRRTLYRALVELRRIRRAWLGLRESMADLADPVQTPAAVCVFLEQCGRLRALAHWWKHEQNPEEAAGQLVWSLACQSTPLAVFRTLLPAQRDRLARDWAEGLAALENQQIRYRHHLESTRPTRCHTGQRVRGEWYLIVLSLLVLILAMFRS